MIGKMNRLQSAERQLKKVEQSVEKEVVKVSRSPYLRDRRVWAAAVVVILLIVFWILPAYAAAAPGQIGYSIKRGEETVVSNLAPLSSWRDSLRLDFANDRVAEAAYVANQANERGDKNEPKTAATISSLLYTYENTYEARTMALNQTLSRGKKPAKSDVQEAQTDAVTTYTTLQLLRLQAPDAAQLAILTAIDDTQTHLAALGDALVIKPLSVSDLVQLARLVSVGMISKTTVAELGTATSNRQLRIQVKDMVEKGTLPSDVTYSLDSDLVKQIAPSKATAFAAVAEFEEMQRIATVIAAARPTAAQKQAIQAFLASYKAGQAVPSSDVQPYIAPIVYGVSLSGRMLTDLPSLDGLRMSSDDQAMFDRWKGVIDPPNLSDVYQRFITEAQNQPDLHLRTLTRMQTELVDAQKAQVDYLVMPPGWSVDQLTTLDKQMGVEIAEAQFVAANPSTSQELTQISVVQQQLEAQLDSLRTTHTETISQLQTKINTFTGTPDQLAQLKTDLTNLDQSQTTTINNVQAQLTAITTAHTKLGDAITNIRQEQLTNLTELELRAATTAQTLTSAAKAELTTSLNTVQQTSQTLISTLQTRVDGLGSGQDQLKTQLAGELTTIRNNYTELKTDMQAQLDAGVATSGQLQSTLSQVQTDLTSQQTSLTNLITSNTAALGQTINQVKNDSQTQVQDLQSQLNVVKLGQQTITASLGNLQNIQQTSQTLIIGLQTQVDSLGAGQAQLREDLTGALQSVQDNYTQLAANTQAQLDAGVATSTQLQTQLQGVQTSLSQHAAQLASLGTSTTNLTQLVNQVKTDALTQAGTLQNQINSLSIDQQTIKTSINDVKTQQAADVASLNTQLAALSTVQAETQAVVSLLAQEQTQAQTNIANLTSSVSTLQTDFDTSAQTQTALQTDIADQQSELDSLHTQTQAALDGLTQQQTQFATQLTNLGTNVTSLSQTVTAVQTASTATQTQLNTLLANPPWSVIPASTFVSQDQFDALTSQINTQFAQKSAQLDQQLQAYEQSLNATTAQLNTQVQQLSATTTTTTSQQTQLQTQVNSLTTQVQTLQTQVQQLLAAATPPGTGL